ncbi:MAG: hypothetical protein JNN00_20040 [Chitinophagaceae bacterium]|nr:hypothetical protein [Chitinophagaceae bacterium]
MRFLIFLISSMMFLNSYAQSIQSIDAIRNRIDNTIFSDTIILNHSRYDHLNHDENEVIGFFHNDSLLKTITRLRTSTQTKTVYYQYAKDFPFSVSGYDGTAIYAKEIDTSNPYFFNEIYARIDEKYSWNHTILKQSSSTRLDDSASLKFRLLLNNYAFPMHLKRIYNHSRKIHIVAQLIEDSLVMQGGCVRNPLVALKIRILRSSVTLYENKIIYIVVDDDLSSQNLSVFKNLKTFKATVAIVNPDQFHYTPWYQDNYRDPENNRLIGGVFFGRYFEPITQNQ